MSGMNRTIPTASGLRVEMAATGLAPASKQDLSRPFAAKEAPTNYCAFIPQGNQPYTLTQTWPATENQVRNGTTRFVPYVRNCPSMQT